MSAPEPMHVATKVDDAFERRCLQAEQGALLPKIGDLIRGCPFFRNDMGADSAAFANGLMNRLAPPEDPVALLTALEAVIADPGRRAFVEAAAAFDDANRAAPDRLKQVGAVRFYFYAALSGCKTSVCKVAAHSFQAAHDGGLEPAAVREHMVASIAWLLAATGKMSVPTTWTRGAATAFLIQAEQEDGPGPSLVERMMLTRNKFFLQLSDDVDRDRADTYAPASESPNGMPPKHCLAGGQVVMRTVGSAQTPEGKRVASEFAAILGHELPTGVCLDKALLSARLLAEFPHAAPLIENVVNAMPYHGHPTARPLAIAGPRGCGKTLFALRLAAMIGVPTAVFPRAGSSDTTFGGTSRRWATGGPSAPLAIIHAHRHAGPALILDDLDNPGPAGGTLADVLPGMLEPTIGRQWLDPYIEAPIDLSRVVWLATLADRSALPAALRDRFSVVDLPAPVGVHVAPLAASILKRRAIDRGLDPRWAVPLGEWELEAIRSRWRGGSIRVLARMVEAVAERREAEDTPH